MKLLLVIAGLLVVCTVQESYQYSAYLDPEEKFLINWEVRTEQNTIEFEFVVKTRGWFSFLIASEDGLIGDVIRAGLDDALGQFGVYATDMHCDLIAGPSHNPPVVDKLNDLIKQSGSYSEEDGTTTVVIKRSINTGDVEDVVIRSGPLLLGWSIGDTDNVNTNHSAHGWASMPLIFD